MWLGNKFPNQINFGMFTKPYSIDIWWPGFLLLLQTLPTFFVQVKMWMLIRWHLIRGTWRDGLSWVLRRNHTAYIRLNYRFMTSVLLVVAKLCGISCILKEVGIFYYIISPGIYGDILFYTTLHGTRILFIQMHSFVTLLHCIYFMACHFTNHD